MGTKIKEWFDILKYFVELNPAKTRKVVYVLIAAIVIKVIFTLYTSNVFLTNELNTSKTKGNSELIRRIDSANLASYQKDVFNNHEKDSLRAIISGYNKEFKEELDKIKNTRMKANELIKKIKK